MSYVLDALRKSEQDRQVAAGQSASVLYPVMVEARRGESWRPLWIGGGLALLLAALLATWWLRAPAGTAVAPMATAPTAPAAPPPAAAAVSTAAPPPAIPAPSAVAIETLAPPPVVKVVPGRTVAAVAPSAPPVPLSEPARRPASAATGETPAKPESKPAATGESRDLPPSLQRELPAMNIAGYIHDGDDGSMAMINDKLVREGEEVAPGLRLEKILPDGALFSYKGQRFRR